MQPSPRSRTAGGRVILADDNPELRSVLAEFLRGNGYLVAEMKDGKELVDYIESTLLPQQPEPTRSLLISDIHMPRCSGLEALAILRAGDRSTPAVLMTGAADEAVCLRAHELGAALLTKPLDLEELRQLICRLLSGVPAPGQTRDPGPRESPS